MRLLLLRYVALRVLSWFLFHKGGWNLVIIYLYTIFLIFYFTMVGYLLRVALPVAKCHFGGEILKSTHILLGKKNGILLPHAIMMLLWLWATLEWRAVCAERCTCGSERRSREIARLRPASYSTVDIWRLALCSRCYWFIFSTSCGMGDWWSYANIIMCQSTTNGFLEKKTSIGCIAPLG